MNQKAILLKDAKRKTINVLYSTPYERDTPNMSRAIGLKPGERNSVSCFCNSRSPFKGKSK